MILELNRKVAKIVIYFSIALFSIYKEELSGWLLLLWVGSAIYILFIQNYLPFFRRNKRLILIRELHLIIIIFLILRIKSGYLLHEFSLKNHIGDTFLIFYLFYALLLYFFLNFQKKIFFPNFFLRYEAIVFFFYLIFGLSYNI